MTDMDANEENASRLVGRSVVKVRVQRDGDSGEPDGLWIDLDDGSRVILNGLRRGLVEIDWQSPDEVFDFDREVMEEEIADDYLNPDP